MGEVFLPEQANLLHVMSCLKDMTRRGSDSSQTIPAGKARNWYAVIFWNKLKPLLIALPY